MSKRPTRYELGRFDEAFRWKGVVVAGGALANVAYNLAQDERVPMEHRTLLERWRKQWDLELAAARKPSP